MKCRCFIIIVPNELSLFHFLHHFSFLVCLAGIAILINLHGTLGGVLGVLVILWCTKSATFIFENALGMQQQRYLIAYPVALFYTAFALLSIFNN